MAEEDHKGFEGMLSCKRNDSNFLNVYLSFQGEIVPQQLRPWRKQGNQLILSTKVIQTLRRNKV